MGSCQDRHLEGVEKQKKEAVKKYIYARICDGRHLKERENADLPGYSSSFGNKGGKS